MHRIVEFQIRPRKFGEKREIVSRGRGGLIKSPRFGSRSLLGVRQADSVSLSSTGCVCSVEMSRCRDELLLITGKGGPRLDMSSEVGSSRVNFIEEEQSTRQR